MSNKNYLITLAIVIVALLVIIGGFNWLVDPYDVYGSVRISGFNALKPEISTHVMMNKAYTVRQTKPEAIVLGTSRAEIGIDPEHPGWAYHPVYNLALSGANIYEILRYFQHADAVQPLKQVVLTLDFFTFSSALENTPDFSDSYLAVNYDGSPTYLNFTNIISSLFSIDSFTSSVSTVLSQNSQSLLLYSSDGRNIFSEYPIMEDGGYHNYFNMITKISSGTYDPGKYDVSDVNAADSPFSYYRKILDQAYREKIDLRMMISPCHAHQWEALAIAGSWDKWEQWKRLLVTINEEEAEKYGVTAYPLWDFSGYSEFSTEALPALNDTSTRMQWYWDPSHYKKELGDIVLDCILGYRDPARPVPDDFGVLLNSGNMDSVLKSIEVGRQNYEATHPADIAEIKSLNP